MSAYFCPTAKMYCAGSPSNLCGVCSPRCKHGLPIEMACMECYPNPPNSLEPRVAHSKSEMRRLQTMGVDVKPPAQSEGREWFINPVAKYICAANENGIGLTGNEIHVIEKSAYDELESAYKNMSKAAWETGAKLRAEVDRLGAEVEELMKMDYWQDRYSIAMKSSDKFKIALEKVIEEETLEGGKVVAKLALGLI